MYGYLLIAYILGSFPVGYLITRTFSDRDIREVGSRNVGATNVAKTVGALPGLLTLAGDASKGYLAALLGRRSQVPMLEYIMPALAITGHNWPVWLSFRGGGGLATFLGGCLALSNMIAALTGVGLWGLIYLWRKDHDKSAMYACVLTPLFLAFFKTAAQTMFVVSSSVPIFLRRVQSLKTKNGEGSEPSPPDAR